MRAPPIDRTAGSGFLALLVALLGLAAVGCGGPFPPLSQLEGLRVLGAHAEPAEVSPGDAVTLRALALDTAGKPITYSWYLCDLQTALASSSTVNQDCVTQTPGAGSALTPLGSGEAVTFSVPAFDPSKLGLGDSTFGIFVPIRLTARAPGVSPGDPDRVVEGIYKLRITNPLVALACPTTRPNRNPVIAGVEARQQDDGSVVLTARFTPDSLEGYCAVDADKAAKGEMGLAQKTEQPTVRWFSTAGRFSNDVVGDGNETTFTVPTDTNPPPAGSPIDLYGLGRDDRGGTSLLYHATILRR